MNWLRENFKFFIIITVVAFVAVIFFQWGMNYLGAGGGNQSMALVNGHPISFSEFQQRVDRLREQRQERNPGPLRENEMAEIRKQAFNQLLNEYILQQMSTAEGVTATDPEIRTAIQQYFQDGSGQVNLQQMRRFLQQTSPSELKQLAEQERERINTYRMRQVVSEKISLTETEIEQLTKTGLREADLYGIYVDPQEFISPKRIQSHYVADKRSYMAPPRAKVRDILVEKTDTGTEAGGQNFEALQKEVSVIRRRFQAGDSFALLAREYSEDTTTADEGGRLGWVTADQLEKPLARAVFSMNADEMSNLVKASDGYHLLYLEAGPVHEKRPLPSVRHIIKRKLLSDTHWTQAKVQAQKRYDELKNAANPFSEFKDLALIYSHGKTASHEGTYGWVPARFIVQSLHNDADTHLWRGEIAGQFLIDPEITQSVFGGPPDSLREPVRSSFGFHVFYVNGFRAARTEKMSEEDQELIEYFLKREKTAYFVNQWLKEQREQLDVELNVPEERIGGALSGS